MKKNINYNSEVKSFAKNFILYGVIASLVASLIWEKFDIGQKLTKEKKYATASMSKEHKAALELKNELLGYWETKIYFSKFELEFFNNGKATLKVEPISWLSRIYRHSIIKNLLIGTGEFRYKVLDDKKIMLIDEVGEHIVDVKVKNGKLKLGTMEYKRSWKK